MPSSALRPFSQLKAARGPAVSVRQGAEPARARWSFGLAGVRGRQLPESMGPGFLVATLWALSGSSHTLGWLLPSSPTLPGLAPCIVLADIGKIVSGRRLSRSHRPGRLLPWPFAAHTP